MYWVCNVYFFFFLDYVLFCINVFRGVVCGCSVMYYSFCKFIWFVSMYVCFKGLCYFLLF